MEGLAPAGLASGLTEFWRALSYSSRAVSPVSLDPGGLFMKLKEPRVQSPDLCNMASWQILSVALTFVLVARVWDINQHVVFAAVLLGLGAYIAWSKPPLNHSVLGYTPLALMGLLFLVMAGSSLWAPEFDRTFSYSVFSFLHFLIGIAVAVAFPLARIAGGIILGVAGIALYGLALGIVDPARAITNDLVMGEFTNSSELSHFLGIGFVVGFGAFVAYRSVRVLLALFLVGLLVYLAYLGYLTSFVSLGAALWVYLLVALARWRGPQARLSSVITAAAGTSALVTVAWFFRVPLQVLAGKTPDFSGRIPFWEHFWSLALANPWGGLGWGWLTWAPPGEEPPVPVQEYFPAHQGYIEFAYMVGIPAMSLVIGVLLILLGRSFWSVTDVSSNTFFFSVVPALIAYLAVFDLAATFWTRTIGMFLLGTLVVLASRLVDDSQRLPRF